MLGLTPVALITRSASTAARSEDHARHHAVAHLHHGEGAAHGQRLHDDAADEAGAHLQHARAGFGQRRGDGARVGQVQQVCTPAGHARDRRRGGRRAGGDQQAVVGQRAVVERDLAPACPRSIRARPRCRCGSLP